MGSSSLGRVLGWLLVVGLVACGVNLALIMLRPPTTTMLMVISTMTAYYAILASRDLEKN